MIHPDADARRMLVREHHAVLAREAARTAPARREAGFARVSLHRRLTPSAWLVALRPVGRRP